MKICSAVLGNYVNAYGIVNELYHTTQSDIIVLAPQKYLAGRSNKIKAFQFVKMEASSLLNALHDLHQHYDKIILFPTSDDYLENLYEIYDEIKSFCFVPLNQETFLDIIKKDVQYRLCEEVGVPIPKSVVLEKGCDIREDIKNLMFPLIIKPTIRDDLRKNVFRNMVLNTKDEFEQNIASFEMYLNEEIDFLVSEFISGDDDCLYSHVGYRSKSGQVMNDWSGHKLSQFPRQFGVVSSAISEAPDIVKNQSDKLLEAMHHHGLFQSEFKYDSRDKQYKLMEVNLRSFMWNKTGFYIDRKSNYALYMDALDALENIQLEKSFKQKSVHFIYMKHEIFNLLSQKGYFKIFAQNVFTRKHKVFATFDVSDLKPFLFDNLILIKRVIKIVWKKIF